MKWRRRSLCRATLQIHLDVGWAEWVRMLIVDVALALERGALLGVEPHSQGRVVVALTATEAAAYVVGHWRRWRVIGTFQTRTWGNATTVTPSLQDIYRTYVAT
ncbi:MAG: hypothetical protein R2867_24970 [Caldilineaceae bacterium]